MTHPTRVWFPLKSNICYAQPETIRNDWEALFKQTLVLFDELWLERGSLAIAIRDDGVWSLSLHPDGPGASHGATRVSRPTDRTPIKIDLEDFLSAGGFPPSARAKVVDLLPKVEMAAFHLESNFDSDPFGPRGTSLLDTQIYSDLVHDIARAIGIGAALAINDEQVSHLSSLNQSISFPTPNLTEASWMDLIDVLDHPAVRTYRSRFWEIASSADRVAEPLHGDEVLLDAEYLSAVQSVAVLVSDRGALAETEHYDTRRLLLVRGIAETGGAPERWSAISRAGATKGMCRNHWPLLPGGELCGEPHSSPETGPGLTSGATPSDGA